MTWLPLCAAEFSVAPLWSWAYWCLLLRRPAMFYPGWAAGAALVGLVFLAAGAWLMAGAMGASAVVALILWWLSRRKGRKRVAKLLGAKARALREKLTRSMPRWEPRLQPQGART